MGPDNNPLPPQAPTPIAQPIDTPTPSISPEKPKKPTGLITATVVFAILAVAGIAGAVYFFMDANSKATSINELRAKLDLIQNKDESEFIEEQNESTNIVKNNNSGQSEVKAIVKQIYDSISTNISNGRFNTIFGDGSRIKIPNSEIYTSSDESYGVASDSHFYDPSAENTIMSTAYNYVEAILSDKGFIEDEKGRLLSDKLFYNADTGIYCTVSEGSIPYIVECSKDTWITDQNKNLNLSLAKLAGVSYVAADASKITDSEISPYQRLMANGPGAALLYYRISPDADWQFFTGTQAVLNCADYNTQDLKNAFSGEPCYDNGESTVQP